MLASEVKLFQTVDFPKYVCREVRKERIASQPEDRTILRASQLTRQQEKPVAQFGQGQVPPSFLQAIALECRDQIVGEANDFQEDRIGGERGGGYLTECEVFAQLADADLHGGPPVIEMPDADGSEREVGDPGTIDETAQGEKGGLRFRLRNESSRDHETASSAPTLRAMLKVSHFPIPVDGFIPQAGQPISEGRSQAGHDSILAGLGFEGVENRVESKTRIGASANLTDVGRHVGEAGIQQFDAALLGSGVPGTQFGIPEVRRVRLDAE